MSALLRPPPRSPDRPDGSGQVHRQAPVRRVIASLLTLPPLLVYVTLFALIMGESAGLPLPGETGLIATSALAARPGGVSIAFVIPVAAAAAIAGDNAGFALGRRGGRWLLS